MCAILAHTSETTIMTFWILKLAVAYVMNGQY
jgi:hypothetical protein